MERPSEHVEHVEHQQHAAHSPFDRRVAMTMAIVAALLASVTMLSHRAHNETLRLQNEAAILQTESGILHTQATDQWGFYQAKNIRGHQYTALLAMSDFVARDASREEELKKATDYWRKQAKKYEETDLPKIKADAERLTREAKDKLDASIAKQNASHEVHKQGDRFDLGELGLELGLILCSIAVLTKRAGFWYSGIVAAITGVVAGATAFLIHGH
ncbi:MAG: DUF4337 domain-containing protein [Gemmataceae bacterium]|nr:DUF4337 domain-containing protein [Gemmataceae bacterium]